MKTVTALFCGLLFGAGLILSGMTSPDRVIGFLDVAGDWNPSLAFVMAGAIMAATPLFLLARRWKRPLADEQFDIPGTTTIDRRLLSGSAIFGIGWGLSGICPGPALVDLGIKPVPTIIFVLAMLCGLAISSLAGKSNV